MMKYWTCLIIFYPTPMAYHPFCHSIFHTMGSPPHHFTRLGPSGVSSLAPDFNGCLLSFFLHQTSWKTRESTDSPPCNCQHLFLFHSQDEMLKTQRFFYIFHLWKAFREYHFVLRVPIQNEESGTLCRRNDHFLPSKNGTCDGNILPPLEASRPLPTIFVGSSMGFVFLGKSHWLPFFSSFLVCASVATYYQRDIKLTFALVHNMCKRSNIFYEP